MKNYKIAAALLIIHGGFMEIAGVLAMIPALLWGTDKYDVGQYFKLVNYEISMSFLKDELVNSYDLAKKNICYKPLLLVSGREFYEDGRSLAEKAESLLEDDFDNLTEYKIKDEACDDVRW